MTDSLAVQEPEIREFRFRVFAAKSENELETIRKEAEAAGKDHFLTDDIDNQKRHLEYIAKRTRSKP